MNMDELVVWLRTPEALAGGLWFIGIALAAGVLIELLRTVGRVLSHLKFRRKKKEQDERWRTAFKARVEEDSATEALPKVVPSGYQDSGVGGARLFTGR